MKYSSCLIWPVLIIHIRKIFEAMPKTSDTRKSQEIHLCFSLHKQFEILPQVIKKHETAVKDIFYEMMKKQPSLGNFGVKKLLVLKLQCPLRYFSFGTERYLKALKHYVFYIFGLLVLLRI